MASVLKIEGWPKPVLTILSARSRNGVGPLGADLDHRARLEDAHLLDDVEDEEAEIVDAVRAVRLQAADVDQGEVGVGAALLGRDADLGRGGLVVELDPEGLEQLPGAIPSSGVPSARPFS